MPENAVDTILNLVNAAAYHSFFTLDMIDIMLNQIKYGTSSLVLFLNHYEVYANSDLVKVG